MKNDNQNNSPASKQWRSRKVLLPAVMTMALLLGACGGDNGGGDNGGAETPTAIVTSAAAAGVATSASDAGTTTSNEANGVATEVVEAAATNTISNGVGTGTADVAVITSTQLVTGTEVLTSVTVNTNTAVIAQQLITTVITNTDIVSNVVQTNDSSTITQSALITEASKATPESSTGQAVANVTITPLAPTATPTVVVQVTRVVTSTAIVTNTEELTAVATPQPGQSQSTGAVTQPGATTFAGFANAQGKTMLASTLLNSKFLTSDGDISGQIQDAVVDLQTSQILYLLLKYGGVLGIGDNASPAPLNAMSIKQDGSFLVNVPPNDLQKLGDVGGDWPQAGNANWDTNVRDFWSREGFPVNFDTAASGNRVRLLSDLVTGPTNDMGLGAGTVEDMIVSLDQGRVAYALVSFPNGAAVAGTPAAGTTAAGTTAGANWYAVPLSAFDVQNADKGLTFRSNFNGSMLQNAPHFDPSTMGQDGYLPNNYDQDWRNFWNKLTNP